MKVVDLQHEPSPTTYDEYVCLMCAHGCECLILTPEQWALLQATE